MVRTISQSIFTVAVRISFQVVNLSPGTWLEKKTITIRTCARMQMKKDSLSLVIVPILNGTLVMWNHRKKLEDTMAANTIIVILLGFIAALAVMAWFLDNWRNNDDDDDFEPYG